MILGLIVMAGLSLRLNQLADTHGSATSLQTSKIHADGELHSEEATDPHAVETTHPHPEEVTDPHPEEAMDHSNMPGMDHSNTEVIDVEANRPLKETLGTFGVATSIVLSGALILRRRDDKVRRSKAEARKVHGESQ